MAVPKFEETMLPILKVMSDGKGRTNGEIKKEVAKYMNLSEEDLNIRNGAGTIKFFDNCGFAISYVLYAGLLDRPSRNYYLISGKGKEVLKHNPSFMNVNYLKKINPNFSVNIRWSKKSNESDNVQENETPDSGLTPTELIEKNADILKNRLMVDLLDTLRNGDFYFFEKVCKDLLLAMGYGYNDKAGWVTKKSNDGGIDGIIWTDKLGLDKIKFQAKRYAENAIVGRPAIQAFKGSIDNNKGVFITTSGYTKDALEYAEKYDNLILVDGHKLAELMYAHGVGVRILSKYEIKAIDADYFDDEM